MRLGPPRRFAELDLALEWAEDVVLARGDATGDPRAVSRFVPLADHPALAGLTPDVEAFVLRSEAFAALAAHDPAG